MSITEIELRKIIKCATIKSISGFSKKALGKKEKEKSFQVLDLLMPKERKIRSIVGGLETSMGRTLWEPLAKEIAEENGFIVVKDNLKSPTLMPNLLSNIIQNVNESRSNNAGIYNANESHEAIKQVCQHFINNPISSFQKAPRGLGVDIWLQKDGIDYFFDTKTVQPNIAGYGKLLTQLLNWYAYFYANNPSGQAVARIVFPYNPHNGSFWDRTKGKGKPLEKVNEAWVEDEFWDFISGYQGTFGLIKEIFKEIYSEGVLEKQLDDIFERNIDKIIVE